METEDQRHARRLFSGWVTEQLNTKSFHDDFGARVRGEVLTALSKINDGLTLINQRLIEKEKLVDGREYICFYMKGGNAFDCVVDPTGPKALKDGGGSSDWDTQVVVDPWLPEAIQNTIYGLVEDTVLDVLNNAGIEIAKIAGDSINDSFPEDFVKDIENLWSDKRNNIKGFDASLYTLSLDDPQALRKIYDRDKTGLWMNDSKRLANKTVKYPKWIPGMTFNDAIKPFVLWRLGYTWHADKSAGPPGGAFKLNVDINRPILAELIDVTIPRSNTVEAVEVWEHLKSNHISVEEQTVNVEYGSALNKQSVSADLPLPDVFYHLSEILEMMCEIADGSSNHKDKLPKRINRFVEIWNQVPTKRDKIKQMVLSRIGRDSIGELIDDELAEGRGVVNNLIDEYVIVTPTDKKWENLKKELAKTDDIKLEYNIAKSMMAYVAETSVKSQQDFDDLGRVSTARLKTMSEAWQAFTKLEEVALLGEAAVKANYTETLYAANSDDLTLLDFIYENDYLTAKRIGFSHVDKAAIFRVDNLMNLKVIAGQYLSLFQKWNAAVKGSKVVAHRYYQIEKFGRYMNECIFVTFDSGKATSFITLTTGDASQVPFASAPNNLNKKYASIEDIGRQRKVAAALVEDYLIRTVLSRQYEAVKALVNVS
ncbi:hypothetical protein [Sessilibacter corallicola]|uniref:AIPR protein n=1 Tax=Sessilibacter corallicola TaxID=2904075 RepID=A0ABQ0A5F3_9GAMM